MQMYKLHVAFHHKQYTYELKTTLKKGVYQNQKKKERKKVYTKKKEKKIEKRCEPKTNKKKP